MIEEHQDGSASCRFDKLNKLKDELKLNLGSTESSVTLDPDGDKMMKEDGGILMQKISRLSVGDDLLCGEMYKLLDSLSVNANDANINKDLDGLIVTVINVLSE